MNNRRFINEKIVKWIEHKVKTDYPNDISMVLLYGSYINGTANNRSDVDCYFIPKTDRGYEMALSFIIDGTGYDIFPMSWDRVENISALQEVLLPCIGDVQILYYHSEEELERFKQLQRNMEENLADTSYIKTIIKERFLTVCNMYSQMKLCTNTVTIRKLAGNIIMALADILALYHHDYFHFGLKKQLEDLQSKFPSIPKEFIQEYIYVTQSSTDSAYIQHCFKLLNITSNYLNLRLEIQEMVPELSISPKVSLNYNWLARLYEEICSTFNKIYTCCENGNYSLAFLSAVCLQRDLDEAVEFGGKSYDLLSCYHYNQLDKLADKAKEIEQDYIQRVFNGGATIKNFPCFEAFLKAKL